MSQRYFIFDTRSHLKVKAGQANQSQRRFEDWSQNRLAEGFTLPMFHSVPGATNYTTAIEILQQMERRFHQAQRPR